MKPLLLFLLLSTAAWGQDRNQVFDGFCHPAGAFISHKENGSYVSWIIVSPDYGFMIARDSAEVKYKGDISGIRHFIKQLPKKDRRKVQDVLKDTIYLRPKDVNE